MTTTTTWDVLDLAHGALRTAVAGVGPDQWNAATPCQQWTVVQVLQHAAGDQRGYAGFLTQEGFPTYDPFAPSGLLDGTPLELLEPALAASAAAFAQVAPDAAEVPVPLPQGPLPAWLAAGACALDAGVHSWDIAVATGQVPELDDALAAELMKVAVEIVEPLRGFAYSPALTGDDGAGALDQLLRYLGRDPRWAAAGSGLRVLLRWTLSGVGARSGPAGDGSVSASNCPCAPRYATAPPRGAVA